jgi:hypothetical protein
MKASSSGTAGARCDGGEEGRGFEKGFSRRPPPSFQLQWPNVEDTRVPASFRRVRFSCPKE